MAVACVRIRLCKIMYTNPGSIHTTLMRMSAQSFSYFTLPISATRSGRNPQNVRSVAACASCRRASVVAKARSLFYI